MNPRERLDPQLLEMLSAYLDGRLEGAEKAILEERLFKEESLRRQLAELRSVRDSLRALPLLAPPRSLVLTPALAGRTAAKPSIFSPRRMALGSALASLAFVFVLAVDVLSRGVSLSAAPAPQALSANEAFTIPEQSMDKLGGGESATAQPEATAAPANLQAPSAATENPERGATPPMIGGCGVCASGTSEPTVTSSPTHTPMILLPTCKCRVTETNTANPPAVAPIPRSGEPQPHARLNFQTVAPYLEAFFGIAAVLLAVLAVVVALAAVILRRRS
jgi:hypothetical protein